MEVVKMKRSPFHSIIFLVGLLFIVSVSCNFGNRQIEPTAPQQPDIEFPSSATTESLSTEQPPTETPLPTEIEPEPTDIPTLEPTSLPQEPEPCQDDVCTLNGSFLLARPIAPSGRNTIDPSYRYGDYRQSTRDTHRGVDFLNSTGTPVLAAAAGQVVVAGDDLNTPYGPRLDFYGNLIVVEHNLAGISETLYTLYAHLSEVLVEVGDPVEIGQEIGLVGMSGGVPGSTLHFEVRLGENAYQAARNPELWLEPIIGGNDKPSGTLAGSVLDEDGEYQDVDNIVIEQLAGPGLPALDQFYMRTYERSDLIGLSPWEESFAISELPPGSYQITFMLNGLQQRVVEVLPGMLTMVDFQIE
jgi:hypothetical protein